MADTSFEPERPAVSLDYDAKPGIQQLGESLLFWGASSTLHYCSSSNSDFNDQVSDDLNCFRAHLRPILQYGKSTRFYLMPLVNIYQTNTQTQIDDFPSLTGNNRTTLTAAEAYFESPWNQWKWRLGYQSVEWNDGVLFSARDWSPEPITHLGLRALGSLAGWKVDFVATDAHEESEPLDGHTQVSILGVNFSLPDDSGSIYLAHTNFGSHHSGKSPYAFGHEIVNVGLYTKHRWSRSDLKASILYQDHVRHVDASGSKGSVQDGMGELEFGFYPSGTKPFRVGGRLSSAGRNYIPVFEDYYRLGLSGLVSSRANLDQYRLFIQWQISDNHLVAADYVSSKERSATGFVRQSIDTENGATIGQEFDLLYQWKLNPKHQVMFGAWHFMPDKISNNEDAATGYLVRLSSSL